MIARSVGIAVLGVAVATGARAQSLPVIVFNDVTSGLSDLVAVWTSPFRGSASDYLTAGMVLGVGYAGSAIGPVVAGLVRDLTGSFDATLILLPIVGLAMVAIAAFVPEPARSGDKA